MAALAGALGAALAAMDANLTVGKKGYENVFEQLSTLAVRAQELKSALLEIVDEDTKAFNAVMDAMRLPKSSDSQKKMRDGAIEAAGKQAALVPLHTARLCLDTMKLSLEAARSGNANSATDAATGCNMAHAGLQSAIMNVRVNIKTLADEKFKSQLAQECVVLEELAEAEKAELDRFMASVLAG